MKVKELIEKLKMVNPEEIVLALDPETLEMIPITGFTYGGGAVEFFTDEL